MIDFSGMGAFPFFDAGGNPHISFGLYLPGVRGSDGFSVVVRIIHSADRFNVSVKTQDQAMIWNPGNALDLWTADVALAADGASHSGEDGEYLYRYQLWWTPAGGSQQLITAWFPDPFARSTDIGLMSSVWLAQSPPVFNWTDGSYKTPELQDLVVYELQIEEFNETFDSAIDRLEYLDGLGANCLELMPVTSAKLDFDWGYGPVYHFSPSPRFGGGDGLKRLVDAAHARGMAVILDVVYEHVDKAFAYYRVYNDIANKSGAPTPASPMVKGWNIWGFGPAADFTQSFT
ncbi:MAG: alpha-amylase family glycosyl hydrolase [Acidobacteriota bacterium]|nr:alpha-amylase family glycosyl hydrolase [Acidobacteriota bacterium]